MDAKLKADWVKALRSGEYEQDFATTGYGKKCCVIGVGGSVAGLIVDNSSTKKCAEALGLTYDEITALVNLNDNEKLSFHSLANFIENTL